MGSLTISRFLIEKTDTPGVLGLIKCEEGLCEGCGWTIESSRDGRNLVWIKTCQPVMDAIRADGRAEWVEDVPPEPEALQ